MPTSNLRMGQCQKECVQEGETNFARATRKPNANGERKGEMIKPIVQILIWSGRVNYNMLRMQRSATFRA
jgi:hypothetical protein